MTKTLKPILTELFWLTLSIIVTVLTAVFVFGWRILEDTIDIHLFDTYYVFSAWMIIAPLFLFVTLLTFLIKEARKGFSKTLPNIIILVCGLLLVTFLTIASKELIRLGTSFSGGWTAYPPLSALVNEEQITKEEDPVVTTVVNFINVLQVLVTLTILFVSFRWGRGKQSS